jgi:hypothetical protein
MSNKTNIMKSTHKTENTNPHTGKLVTSYIKKNKIFKSALARYLKRSAPTVEYHLKRPSVQVKLLWEISIALQHNFFSDIAAQLPAHFSSDSPIDTTKDELINTLQEENKQLTTQVATLKEVLQTKT